jgi:hypothetical protein
MALNDYLGCIVGGIPHGGTTFMSSLIKNLDGFCGSGTGNNSGFEYGLLFNQTPKTQNTNPFPMYRRYPDERWGVDVKDREYILNSNSFEETYKRTIEKSSTLEEGKLIVDKAPHYVIRVEDIIAKAKGVPFIVTRRDIRNAYMSYTKKIRSLNQFFIQGNNLYTEQADERLEKLDKEGKICLISHERLLLKDEKEIEKLELYLGKKLPESFYNGDMIYGHQGKMNVDRAISGYTKITEEQIDAIKKHFPLYNKFLYAEGIDG